MLRVALQHSRSAIARLNNVRHVSTLSLSRIKATSVNRFPTRLVRPTSNFHGFQRPWQGVRQLSKSANRNKKRRRATPSSNTGNGPKSVQRPVSKGPNVPKSSAQQSGSNSGAEDFFAGSGGVLLKTGAVLIQMAVLHHVVKTYVMSFTLCVGSSMFPAFNRGGDLALTESITYYFRDPQRGDVVLVREPLELQMSMPQI